MYIGSSEWSFSKYSKTIGKTIAPVEQSTTTSPIYALMLEYIDVVPLSTFSPTVSLVKAALSSISELHRLGIVHGDICSDNVSVIQDGGKTEVMLIDYSSSWANASLEQKTQEFQSATEYFAELVRTFFVFLTVG